MGRPTEVFEFGQGPYLRYVDAGGTDTTTNPQVIGADFVNPIQYVLGNTFGPYFIEPGFNKTVGQTPMDNFARLLFTVLKVGPDPTTATLSFKRGTGGEEFTPPELTGVDIQVAGTASQFLTVVARLPMAFMRDPTGGTLGDTLRCSLSVTASIGGTVVNIAYSILCVPVIGLTPRTNPAGGRGQALGESIQGSR